MANIIDPGRYQLVPNAAPAANAIGNLITQKMNEQLAQSAMAGDKGAYSQLAARDPRSAVAIGQILQDQQAEQLKKQALNQDMAYRVARGYLTAKDKAGYLASASQQLRQGGFEDLAKHVDDDIAQLQQNPQQVDTEYQSLHDMLDPTKTGDMRYGTSAVPMRNTTTGQVINAQAYQGGGFYGQDGKKLGPEWEPAPTATAVLNNQSADTRQLRQPVIAGGVRDAQNTSDLSYKPEITGKTTTAENEAKTSVERSTKEGSAARDEREVDRLLTKADGLLDTATGSYTGRGLDLVARAVGIATKGGISATKLKALEAALVLKMPRMEGPQSDRDAALYKQAAGLIGDATVPSEERKAAIETIRFINSRYTGDSAAKADPKTDTSTQQPSIDDLVKKYAK